MTAQERLWAAEAETRETAELRISKGDEPGMVATCAHIPISGGVVIVSYYPTRGWDYAYAETPEGLWGSVPSRQLVLLALENRGVN